MNSLLTIRNFKYIDLNKTIFSLLRYEKEMKLNILNLNSKYLISSLYSFYFSRVYSSYPPAIFYWDDLVSFNILLNDTKSSHRNCTLYASVLLFLNMNISFLFGKPSSIVSLPNKKEIFTLLRSPHTDKKSREQFRKKEFRKLVKMSVLFSTYFLQFLVKKEYITSKIRSKYVGI